MGDIPSLERFQAQSKWAISVNGSDLMKKALFLALAISLGSTTMVQAITIPGIVVGGHTYADGTGLVEIDVNVIGPNLVPGVNAKVQVGDGGAGVGGSDVGPLINHVELISAGTIFAGNNTGQVDNGTFPMASFQSTSTANGTITSNGLLAKVFIDFSGFSHASAGDLGLGKWSLRMTNTAHGETDFVVFPVDITNGFIELQGVPEPSSLALALCGTWALCVAAIRRGRRSSVAV